MGVALRVAEVGNGGKAQSRFVNSGEGGAKGNGLVWLLRGMRNGDLRPEDELIGDTSCDPLPLLAGVSWSGRRNGRSAHTISTVRNSISALMCTH